MSVAKKFLANLVVLLGPLVGAAAGFFVSNIAVRISGIGMHDVGAFVVWFLIGGAAIGLVAGIFVAYRISTKRS